MLPTSELKSTRKAPPTTLALVVAMECKVVDSEAPKFIGMFAWYRLVRAWTAMRFDDHRGAGALSHEVAGFGVARHARANKNERRE